MEVLITGGSGFIGTRLIEDLLEAGHKVVNLDIRQSSSFPQLTTLGDVRDPEAVMAAATGVDAIVHLAAEHRDDVRPVELYFDVNRGGARQVISAAEANNVKKIVFTSSVAIYGLNVGEPEETSPPRPFNAYGRSKLEAEQIFSEWATKEADRSLIIVRPCVVFGENNRGNVHTLLKQIETGRFLTIGDGANRKSMAYVRNVSQFLISCLKFQSGVQVFNYADKPDISTRELLKTACAALGVKLPPRIPYALGLAAGYTFDVLASVSQKSFPVSSVRVRKFCADTRIGTKRLEALGWQPSYTLEDGLRRMIAHEFGTRQP